MPVTAFFVAFLATLLAELGDKTQLVTLTLSCRYQPVRVLAGSLTALAAITGLAVILGDYLAALLPGKITVLAGGFFFLGVAAFLLLKKETADSEMQEPKGGAFLQAFLLVFLAELGDKTQLTAIALTAAYGNPLAVFLGCMGGQFINHSAACFLGSRFLSRLPAAYIKAGSAVLFLLFGLVFLFSAFRT